MIDVQLSAAEYALCTRNGKSAEVGGRSSVVSDPGERVGKLVEHQLTGQLGNLAFCRYLYGMAFGHYVYRVTRWAADRNPTRGDGGEDVPGCKVDVKASMIRTSLILTEHFLPVPESERHPETTYVLALVEQGEAPLVHLMGWAGEEELPKEKASSGTFAGKFILRADTLHALPPLRWSL